MSENKVTTSKTNWLAECLKVDKDLYKRPTVYKFSNGREFKEPVKK